MAVAAFPRGKHATRMIPTAALALCVVAGCGAAISPYFAFAAVAGLAVLALAMVLPVRVLLFGFVLITLSGIRPLPPVFGFHIQAQYFLIVPLFLRSLTDAGTVSPELRVRWHPLVRSALLVVGASLVAFVQSIVSPDKPFTTALGDYLAWVIVFIFLWVMVRLARNAGSDLARRMYRDVVDALGLFAAYTLITGLPQLHNLSSPGTTRLALADLNPNATGVLVGATILLSIAPSAVGRVRWRDLMWLPFLLPLLVLTGSRESLFALGLGVVILLFYLRGAGAAIRYLYVLIGIVVAVLFAVTDFSSVVPHSLLRTIDFPELHPYLVVFGVHLPPALAERVYIQTTAFHEFLQHPLIGIGFNEGLFIPEGMNAPNWFGPPLILRVGHDSYLTVAAQQGLLGLIPFVLLVATGWSLTRRAVRANRDNLADYALAVGMRVAVIQMTVASFNIDALYIDFKIMTIFLWVLVMAVLLGRTRAAPATEHLRLVPAEARGDHRGVPVPHG